MLNIIALSKSPSSLSANLWGNYSVTFAEPRLSGTFKDNVPVEVIYECSVIKLGHLNYRAPGGGHGSGRLYEMLNYKQTIPLCR